MAQISGLLSAIVFNASISLKGPRAKPLTSGSKPACIFLLPEAVKVASVLPWKALSMTNTVGSLIPFLLPCKRANFIAASFASAPELPKNTLVMPEMSHSFSASCC